MTQSNIKQQNNINQQQNNKSALGFMLGAVVLYSIDPIAFSLGGANNAPFLFAALINFSSLISGLVFLVWWHRTKRKNQTVKETLGVIYSKFYTKAFFWLSMARFQHIFFAMSLSYINVAVASVLAATKPLIMAAFTAWLFVEVGRYQKITAEKWLLFALAFIGAGFVVASQSENFGAIVGDLLNQGAIIGVLLVVLSALIGGMGSPYSLKLGNEVSKETGGDTNDELFFTIAFMFVVWAFGSILFFTIGIATEESFADINIYPAILFGLLVQLLGAVFTRLANIKTDNLSINALGYAIPVVSLIWLGLASLIDVPHFDWLVIGATAIIKHSAVAARAKRQRK